MRLICLVLISLCSILACAQSAKVPDFVAQPVADSDSHFVTYGAGTTETLATKDALAKLSLRLSSQVSAKVYTLLAQTGQGQKTNQQQGYLEQSEQIARRFTFNNYQQIKKQQLDEQVYVVLAVERRSFFASLLQQSEQRLNTIVQLQQSSLSQKQTARLALTQFELAAIAAQIYADAALLNAFNYPNQLLTEHKNALQRAQQAAASYDYEFVLPPKLNFLNPALKNYRQGVGFTAGQAPVRIFITGALLKGQVNQQDATKVSFQLHWLNPQGQMQPFSQVIELIGRGEQAKSQILTQLVERGL
ncbi:hypothetical protein [Gayadomonas joobiniege]|uniref:hypothetical protein n=1 Tax=Gayadomonas joobiniege TaxID=1234606 RepID=UPI000372C8C8|nr:hypothetical protein [Gayadomonas joobiniege]